MRKIDTSEMENWSFKGLPGTDYFEVDEFDNVKLLLSVIKLEGTESNPSYLFVMNVPQDEKQMWHICPWLNDKMVDALLKVAPPSVAARRVMPQEEPQEESPDRRSQ